MRTSAEILRRAIVMTSVGFRASLEVTPDARSEGFSRRLLPWLEEQGMPGAIDPFERELLATPFGQLDTIQQRNANWSGDGANVMCWALGLAAKPLPYEDVGYNPSFDRFDILRSDPQKILADVVPRSLNELSDFHLEIETLRTALQLARTDALLHQVLKTVCLSRLAEIGVEASQKDIDHAVELVASYSPEHRQSATARCVVRGVATSWLIDRRPKYFQGDDEDDM